jgi:hypothetical protein
MTSMSSQTYSAQMSLNTSSESRSRTLIEIGVGSFFQVTSVVQDSDKSVRAHLLRAKSRITAGSSHAALQGLVFRRFYVKRVRLTLFPSYSADLQAILLLDPDHCEARDLLSHFDGEAQKGAGNVSLGWLRGNSAVT